MLIGAAAGSISLPTEQVSIIERGGNLIQCRLAACTRVSLSRASIIARTLSRVSNPIAPIIGAPLVVFD